MNRNVLLTAGLLAAFAIFSAGLFAWKVTTPATFSRADLQSKGVYIHEPPQSLSPFILLSTNQEKVSNTDLPGRWTLIYFGFTHCLDVCPVTLSSIAQALQRVSDVQAKQVRVWMVSVDPQRDDLQTLQGYVQHFSEQFAGLTGPVADIAAFASGFHATFARVPGQVGNFQIDHSSHLALLNPDGEYAAFLREPLNPDRIERFLKLFLDHYPFTLVP